jgi:hypothetical protein
MSVIPLQELTDYTMRIDLDNIPSVIRTYWTEFSDAIKAQMVTDGFWSMDISNTLFTIKGIRVVGGCELMWPYSQIKFGGFYLIDKSGEQLDPAFAGIGDRWELNYIPLADIDALRVRLKLETV